MGWGIGSPQPTRGSGERHELPQQGPGPPPPTHFWHILGPQNTTGRENSVTLLNDVQSPLPESNMFI